MNQSTVEDISGAVETRLDYLITDRENIGGSKPVPHCTSFSSIGSVTWSPEMSHKMEASSPYFLHNASTSSSEFVNVASNPIQSSLLNTDSSTISLLGGCLSASQRYLPNEHHRVVAKSVGSEGSVMHSLETALHSMPAVSSNGDMHFVPGYHLLGYANFDTPASSFGSSANTNNVNLLGVQSNLAVNSAGMYQLNLQTAQQSPKIAECRTQLSLLEAHLPYTKQGKFAQCRREKEFQPSWQGLHYPYIQSDQLQLPREEQYLQQQYALVENKICSRPQIESQVMHEMAQQLRPSEESVRNLRYASNSVAAACGSGITRGEVKHAWKDKILLIYHHAMHCTSHEKECDYHRCKIMKEILKHISHCMADVCANPFCRYKWVLNHYRNCQKWNCYISGPVIMRLENVTKVATPIIGTIEYQRPPLKRIKKEHPSLSKESLRVMDHINQLPQGLLHECQLRAAINTTAESMKLGTKPFLSSALESNAKFCEVEADEPMKLNVESMNLVTKPSSSSTLESNAKVSEVKVDDPVIDIKVKFNVDSVSSEVSVAQCEQDQVLMEPSKVQLEAKCLISASSDAHVTETDLGKRKIRGISLIDSFTPEKIREHFMSLRQCVGQSKEKAEKNERTEHLIDQNSCSLCGMENLLFETPTRYCASCSNQINPKGIYYSMRSIDSAANRSDERISFCSKCHKIPGESVKAGGRDIPKANLVRRRNYIETDAGVEGFVQCDKCKAWQHQICALFNAKRNVAVKAVYTCLTCFLQEIESGEHEPLLQNTVLGAKDLPTTMLSDHIEQWLFRRLKEERQERANSLGMNFDEVPAAEGLVVRVVSSVEKNLEVKQLFREIFQEENYPSEFSYKSKAILLFQKIDGADVCLFGMLVQEFGSECASPNKRHVCLSYIDSVKYFRPEIKTVTGEALRTFVYHEVLIGYLDYCKKRRFTSFYIWACPPLKRDCYILYCHPRMQKIPKSEKLREWYQTLLRKASKEKIVMENTNLYDHFFVLTGECKAKVTAARLPYFDGDYWPAEAEMLLQRRSENKHQNRVQKAAIERAQRAARRDALTGNPKDILLMYQLGEIIRPMKEDFMVVHLQDTCKHCSQPIVSGKQWVCDVCDNFQLCEKCYSIEQNLEKKDRHPIGSSDEHLFLMVEVENVLADTNDEDETIQTDFFDTRMVFLSLCQGNQYQFDTLRRAKHSTMMILYHLHNPTAPAFISSCNVCHNNMDTAQGWHCMTCPGYDICDSCFQRKGSVQHDHKLVRSAPHGQS